MQGFELSTEIERHASAVRDLKKAIEKLPPGKLRRVQNGLYTKNYLVIGRVRTYIPSRNKALVESLSQKEYLEFCMEAHEELKLILENYRDCLECSRAEIEEMMRGDQAGRIILPEGGPFREEEVERWAHSHVTRDPDRAANIQVKGVKDLSVATRADALIAEALFQAAIPFHYAAPFPGQEDFYPDFTALDKGRMKVWYWEHLGRLDDPEQVTKALERLKTCFSHCLYPWNALIVSAESADHPLGREEIGEIIQAHFFEKSAPFSDLSEAA